MEDNKTFSTPLVNDYKTYSMELAGRTLSVDIGRVGEAGQRLRVLCITEITTLLLYRHSL